MASRQSMFPSHAILQTSGYGHGDPSRNHKRETWISRRPADIIASALMSESCVCSKRGVHVPKLALRHPETEFLALYVLSWAHILKTNLAHAR